jgi:hypothetical protein
MKFIKTFMDRRQIIVLIFVIAALTLWNISFRGAEPKSVTFVEIPPELDFSLIPTPGIVRQSTGEGSSERWIVVTSINSPTESIKKLASLAGWKIVVVGDK